MLAWAQLMALSSLPYTSAMPASNNADLHQKVGVRGGTNNHYKQQQQQQQQRWMQDMPTTPTVEIPLPPLSTESSEGTKEVEYSPIYNTRMKTCPGYEAEGLKGYKSLDDLRDDLQLYFYDMNGYSYHRSAEQIAADAAADAMTESPTGHPSASPSVSSQPSLTSSDVPSAIPTQQPVTPAPTDFPTSSLRLPQDPTKSPSPTISPRLTPGTGVVTDIVDEVDGTFSPTVLILGLRTGSPSRTPTLRPVEEDGNRIVERSDRKRMREHIDVEVGSVRRRLQEETTTDAAVVFVEVMSDTGVPELDEIITLTDGEEVLIPVTNSSEESSVAAAGTEEEEGGIHFHICPDTNFQFNSILVAQLKFLPLVVESPVQEPVTLACLQENTCTFSGGNFHIVFNNNGLEEDSLEESSMDQEHSTITVSGINFQESAEASIVMNDPQGTIIFDKCKWENNEGEAIVVDGRYTGKNLEREYYGVDDYMLPPGGVNPYASTDPTVPASTTEFSFVTTTDSAVITTKFTDVVTTETPPTLAVGSEESFRLLQETSVVAPKPKSSILIRKSTFTGNKGDATIAVESYSEDEGLESGTSSTSSINLAIEKSTFSSERVGSVIVAIGAQVSSKGNLFEQNTVTSVIQMYSGTITITETKFEDNVISGGDGLVEVDQDSKVGDTNCVEKSGDGGTATGGPDTTDVCEGTFDIENDICKPFGQVCDPEATPETLSLREGAREGVVGVGSKSDLIVIGIASVSAPQSQQASINSVTSNSSVTLERRKSKSSKSTKPAKPQAQQQQQGSNGRNQKDKGKKSKSSKPKKGGGRKRKRGKR